MKEQNETSIVGGNVICSGSDDKTVRLWDIRTGKQIHIFKGHTSDIFTVEYLPFENGSSDTNIICSGSLDNTIRFWDIRTNKQLHEIKGFDDNTGIYSFEFVPFDQGLKNSEKNKNSTNDCCGYALCYGSGMGLIRSCQVTTEQEHNHKKPFTIEMQINKESITLNSSDTNTMIIIVKLEKKKNKYSEQIK
ncbi:WD repeat-containing protein [Reticulomyxa filosa]|uniref:WD repeat-containing protein n=1 Tax=Reticulomyxa filosa TaxID=46433 RepID=X6PFS0_RETFI|nr:WD repeat-containing protein [Reticulomyxa filosa]|eukprot:ETO36933.1 WD repeat-containing protein [Reticulomyxa filosa]